MSTQLRESRHELLTTTGEPFLSSPVVNPLAICGSCRQHLREAYPLESLSPPDANLPFGDPPPDCVVVQPGEGRRFGDCHEIRRDSVTGCGCRLLRCARLRSLRSGLRRLVAARHFRVNSPQTPLISSGFPLRSLARCWLPFFGSQLLCLAPGVVGALPGGRRNVQDDPPLPQFAVPAVWLCAFQSPAYRENTPVQVSCQACQVSRCLTNLFLPCFVRFRCLSGVLTLDVSGLRT